MAIYEVADLFSLSELINLLCRFASVDVCYVWMIWKKIQEGIRRFTSVDMVDVNLL